MKHRKIKPAHRHQPPPVPARPAKGGHDLQHALELQNSGREAEAIALYDRLLVRDPHDANVWHLRGLALHQTGHHEKALASVQRALDCHPQFAFAHNSLGVILGVLGRREEALAAYRQACACDPTYVLAKINCAALLSESGHHEEALALFDQVLAAEPENAEAWFGLALVTYRMGRLDEAEQHYRKTLALRPDIMMAHYNLGHLLYHQYREDEAEACFRRALELNPLHNDSLNYLGLIYQHEGRMEAAHEQFQRITEINPDVPGSYSNYLFFLGYHSYLPPQAMLEAHRQYEVRYAPGPARVHKAWRGEDNGKLRIGFLSPDFCMHPVSFFIEPLLENLDRTRFSIHAYAEVARPDAVTERLRSRCDLWRSTVGLSDDDVAAMIQRDGVAILIDLAGHTAWNRMGVLLRKPAPVQCHYMGYYTTTGLSTVDYWITDNFLHPPDTVELASETIFRLPKVWQVYRPAPGLPEPQPPPSLANGITTFGSFNNILKVTAATLDLWAQVLHAVAEARLLLKTARLGSALERARITRAFAERGIPAERLLLEGASGDYAEHMTHYHRVDIGLDPTPLPGCTTTCDALWMGVPVINLLGERFTGRVSGSVLHAAGLAEWIAHSPEEYIAKAATFAAQGEARAQLRSGMRERLRTSPLGDAPAFARDFEQALETMWRRRVNKPPLPAGF